MAGAPLSTAAQTPNGGPPPDIPRSTAPTGADCGSALSDVLRIAGNADYPESFLNPRFTNIDQWREQGLKTMAASLRYQPARVPAAAEVLHRDEFPDFVREKIQFSTAPGIRVPAYVFIPRNLKGRAPAIVDLHSHGGMFIYGKEKVIDFGSNHPSLTKYHFDNYEGRPTATELVRRGYVVITIDAFPFGERRIIMDDDLPDGYERSRYSVETLTKLNNRCRSKESTVVKSLAYAGTTWPGLVAWDDMRTVDYLASRPEVDPSRIGCVGVSLGGYRSLLLAGLDSRIAAGVVVGFMSTVRSMIPKHMDTHSFVHFIPGLHAAMDLPDVIGLRAPKPLMVLQCRKDGLFPLSGMEAALEKLKAIYAKAGAPQAFSSGFYDIRHMFNIQMQNHAFAWLDKHLKS